MARKSVEERIADFEERIRQLEARKKSLEQQAKLKERKERTRRLIQIGAIMAHLGIETIEQAQRLQNWYTTNPRRTAQLRAITEDTGLDGLLGTTLKEKAEP